MHNVGIIERYRAHMPVSDATRIITLNEGSTPLIAAPALSAAKRSARAHSGTNPMVRGPVTKSQIRQPGVPAQTVDTSTSYLAEASISLWTISAV